MKKRLMNNLALKIAAVLFAALLWFVVVNEIDPVETRTFSNVVVSMAHDELITNKGNTYRIVNGNTISVEVTAKQSILRNLNSTAIVATADIKDIQLASFVPIKVKVPKFEGKYEYTAVASPTNVEIKIESSKSKRFPISVETVGTQQDGLVIGALLPRPESVQISGPMSLVGRIKKAVARVDINGITKDTTLEADLILYDEAGNIIDQTSLANNIGEDKKVQVRVNVLSTKSVNIQVDASEIPLKVGYKIGEVTCEPQKIKIAGENRVLSEVQEIVIPASALHVDEISSKTEVTVDITEALPQNIRLVNENEKNVVITIHVERAGTRSYDIPISSIKKLNVPSEFKPDFGTLQVVTLHLTGDDEALENMTLEQLIPRTYIDFKDYTEEKTYTIPVRVAFPDGITFVEEPVVMVTMKKIEEELQTEE